MALMVIINQGIVNGHFSMHFLKTFFHLFSSFSLPILRISSISLFMSPLLIAKIFCSVVSQFLSQFQEFWFSFALSSGEMRWRRSKRLWSVIFLKHHPTPSRHYRQLMMRGENSLELWRLKIENEKKLTRKLSRN